MVLFRNFTHSRQSIGRAPAGDQASPRALTLVLTLGVASLAVAGCDWGACRGPINCCASCDGPVTRRATCACAVGETPVQLCGKRSACAIDFHVGDGPARCCGGCGGSDYYEEASGNCRGDDPFLHECAMDSACFQTYQAGLLDAAYVPFAPVAVGLDGYLAAVWADAADNVWVVGSAGRLLHGGPAGWQALVAPTREDLHAVWGAGDEVWIAGNAGVVLRRRDGGAGGDFEAVTSGVDVALYGLGGTADGELWVVGAEGTILRRDGDRLVREPAPTVEDLVAVWAAGDEAWAVGGRGTILRRSGGTWRAQASSTEEHLTGIWGAGDSPEWIVGLAGTLLRRRGDGWRAEEPPVPAHLVAVHGVASDDVWVVGADGVILRHDGARWHRVSYFFGSGPHDLLGVWGLGRSVWIVGDEGTLLRHAGP